MLPRFNVLKQLRLTDRVKCFLTFFMVATHYAKNPSIFAKFARFLKNLSNMKCLKKYRDTQVENRCTNF